MRELDRLDRRQPPRRGSLVLGEQVLDIGDTPHPAHEQFGVSLHRGRVDDHLLDAEVCELGLVGVRLVVQRHADAVDDFVPSLFPDRRAHQPGFVAVHIVLAQDLAHRVDAGLDRRLVAGGAVLAQKVFQNVGRNDRVAFDRLDQVLANHQAGKVLIDLVVERAHQGGLGLKLWHGQKSNSLVNERRIV